MPHLIVRFDVEMSYDPADVDPLRVIEEILVNHDLVLADEGPTWFRVADCYLEAEWAE